MILSMTAFARRETHSALGSLSWELRTVNHRYLEISPRLPEDLRGLEMRVREQIQKRIRRGKVDATLRWTPPVAGENGALAVNEALLNDLARLAAQVGFRVEAQAPLSALDFLKWPGVLQSPSVDLEQLHEAALALLRDALRELVDSRAREGEKLAALLRERLDAIEATVAEVRARVPALLADYRSRLEERLGELRDKVDPARLEQEIVLFATRIDVAEELDRLDTHVGEVRRILGSDEAVGRRLDFMMQELNREANTLGSKSADAQTTQAAVTLKVLIEQMREQVQNIE
ncbi:MAG: YicC/YloC family endoribonuclease [Pseudomonadota bacterium]|uniref:YicC/YloC family endoribonuclease n=1 Tax=Thermithiobacillus tepidarius TaxID=929 RepID=UPI0004283810|nr:YicC/YloC family endoribonuclease [Thermithiobacillus tepidarius]